MRAMPTDGQNLCLSCGLCCDGTLFTDVRVGPEESGEVLGGRQRITSDRGGEGRYELPQPCLRFENGRCQTYGCRPAACSSYRCRLLRRVEAGEMALQEAKGIVQSAREKRQRLRRLLDRHFPELAGEPLRRAIRIVHRFLAGMDESRRRRSRDVHAEFLSVAASLGGCLEHFTRTSSARHGNGLG